MGLAAYFNIYFVATIFCLILAFLLVHYGGWYLSLFLAFSSPFPISLPCILLCLSLSLRDPITYLQQIEKRRRYLRQRPRRIILIRHGESEGNVDSTVYSRTPDHAVELTSKGIKQARVRLFLF